ncbi:MAG TPA: hypothetical protein VFJ11_00385 [Gaiellaceae bacterium]|nr:hypothetical protein [Gaiellaceae bacterium]
MRAGRAWVGNTAPALAIAPTDGSGRLLISALLFPQLCDRFEVVAVRAVGALP